MADAVGEPEPRRERRAGADVGLGEVHEGDRAAELGGQRTRRTAEPPADIEHAQARAELSQAGQSLGRGPAAAVKMIGGRQIVNGRRVDVPAGGRERVENPPLETVAPPVGVGRARVAPVHGGSASRPRRAYRRAGSPANAGRISSAKRRRVSKPPVLLSSTYSAPRSRSRWSFAATSSGV